MLLLVTATVNTILLTNPCTVAFSCSVITLKICLQLYSFETFINGGDILQIRLWYFMRMRPLQIEKATVAANSLGYFTQGQCTEFLVRHIYAHTEVLLSYMQEIQREQQPRRPVRPSNVQLQQLHHPWSRCCNLLESTRTTYANRKHHFLLHPTYIY